MSVQMVSVFNSKGSGTGPVNVTGALEGDVVVSVQTIQSSEDSPGTDLSALFEDTISNDGQIEQTTAKTQCLCIITLARGF